MQELTLPFDQQQNDQQQNDAFGDELSKEMHPHLHELAREMLRSNYSFQTEFTFGLGVILDALEARLHHTG